MSKCTHELCKYWNKERGSCFFFVEGSGEIKDMPCYEVYHNLTFAEFCELVSDTPLNEFQKHTCDAIEEKYRKDGNFDSCVPTMRGGGPRSIICDQLIALFSLYLKCEEAIK